MGGIILPHWKIVVAGEGGQGVQALAATLALAAHRNGLNSLYIPNFGIEQRGGVSLALVQFSAEAIGAPKFEKAGLIVALSPRSLKRCRQYDAPGTLILHDSSRHKAPEVADQVIGRQVFETIAPEAFAWPNGHRETPETEKPGPFREVFRLPAADLARRRLNPRVFNMIVLGGVAALVKTIPLGRIREALETRLGHRFSADPQLRNQNHAALELGFDLVRKQQAVSSREQEAIR